MSDFFQEVYEIVRRIPEGTVVTYGQIARALGRPRAARIVGYAMRCAPADRHLPCHRVVNRSGEMAPDAVFGSAQLQRTLLKSEGVSFLENGRIDMGKSLWHGV